jgi:hypothetical protein
MDVNAMNERVTGVLKSGRLKIIVGAPSCCSSFS